MRLKTLEIRGFKSFADKTVINFGENVIGIVGSNGCGKSNIVDAMRWVLGEQKTSQLRSESMTNVIFNGTKNRKAAGFAEVSLLFENDKGLLPTEYREVAIRRTLYQDGSSEYRLNEVKCRLKDIQSLLGDTGMESSTYAIIALDMVDDLLQDKDNARLRLFEQAAGIAKYKLRKKETLQKLDGTEADLLRVEDLLAEIDQNMKLLEKQAKRARKYLEMREEYKQLSLDWACLRMAKTARARAELSEKIEQERQAAERLEAEIQTLETGIETEKFANIDKEKALSEAQRLLNRCTGNLRTKENEAKMLEQKEQFAAQSKEKLQQRIAAANGQIEQQSKNTAHYQESLHTEEQVLVLIQQDFDRLQTNLQAKRSEHEQAKRQNESSNEAWRQSQRLLVETEKRLAILRHQLEEAQRQIRQNQNAAEQNAADQDRRTQQLAALQQNQQQAEEQLAALRQRENQRRSRLSELDTELEQLRQQAQVHNRQLDALRSEYKLLKNWVDNLEGYSESIKFLSKNPEWQPAAPLLSDVLACRADYQKCIEDYLDTYLSYYLVENRERALQALSLLDRSRKGKANFFLLDQVPPSPAPPTPLPTRAQPALSFLEMEERYRPLAEFLLKNVYVVESMDDIEPELKQINWISRDGKYIRRRFSIHGGAPAVVEAQKLGRKKSLERLQERITAADTESQALQSRLQALQQLRQDLARQDLQADIQRAEQKAHQILRELTAARAQTEQGELRRQEAEQRQTHYKNQIELLQPQIEEQQALLSRQQEHFQQNQAQAQEQERLLRSLSDTLSQEQSAFNQKNIELVRQQNKIAALRRECEFGQKQIEELQNQIRRENEALLTLDTEAAQNRKQLKLLRQEIEELNEERWEFQQRVQSDEKTYFESKGQIASLEENLRRLNKSVQAHIQLQFQLESRLNELRLEHAALNERLKIEFDVEAESLLERPLPEGADEGQLEREAEELRRKLAAYGSVNHTAIEAYQEIKERYDFIHAQRQDLLQAKETLLETMREIEQAATIQFMQAFTLIRGHFIRVFRSLFAQDDMCDLVLTRPEQPLESQVEIIANPKSKKPLTINQLSGGEKTLTATALLFAVYLLKPAPFCIFDEVDAPLDDTNIAKFNRIIREFSKDSQFIIVTHNKKTMEAVDILYGVTMVDAVSRVVPVDFRRWEPSESNLAEA